MNFPNSIKNKLSQSDVLHNYWSPINWLVEEQKGHPTDKREAIKGESCIDIAGPLQAKNKGHAKINERERITGRKRVTSESRNEGITQEDGDNKPENIENSKKHNDKTC